MSLPVLLGTTLVVVPTAVAQSIHAQIPGVMLDEFHGWIIPNTPEVAALKGVQLVLNGVKFDIVMKDIMRERVLGKRGYVYSGIASNDRVVSNPWSSYSFRDKWSSAQNTDIESYLPFQQPVWILGDVFIKENYASTNVPR